jgi:hypothetical protein
MTPSAPYYRILLRFLLSNKHLYLTLKLSECLLTNRSDSQKDEEEAEVAVELPNKVEVPADFWEDEKFDVRPLLVIIPPPVLYDAPSFPRLSSTRKANNSLVSYWSHV